jgi:arsenite-transporting ATPase
MSIDAIIMNRILPDDIQDVYFKEWRKSQRKYLKMAKQYFSPIPIFPVKLFKDEVLGYDSLEVLADQIYDGRNPLERFFKGEPYNLIKDNGEYRLTMKLPFITKQDVELNKFSDELIVKVGGFKKHMLLPRQVAAVKKIRAKLEGQLLSIYFEGDKHGQGKK